MNRVHLGNIPRRFCASVHLRCFHATHRLWSRLPPHTRLKFPVQTSALTRIVLGLVDRIAVSGLVPDPQSSRGQNMLDSVSWSCSRQFLHQSFGVYRSYWSDLLSRRLDGKIKEKPSHKGMVFLHTRNDYWCTGHIDYFSAWGRTFVAVPESIDSGDDDLLSKLLRMMN